jgi:predicted nucleic acid-binding protein
MLSLDTNILVYSTDKDDPAKQSTAIDILTSAARLETGLTEQSIIEFVHAVTRKARMPLNEVAHIVRRWLNSFSLLVPAATVVEDTLDLLVRHRLSVWDARLLAVCAANGCDILLSEDLQDNAVYAGVRVLNPFNARNSDLIADLLRT